MTLVVLAKARGMLVPADEDSERFVAAIPAGGGLEVDAKARRNVRFHRKYFALLRLVFDSWEPSAEPDERISAVKSFDGFREQVLILAGHCDAVFNLDGTFRLVAKSISFEALGEEGFSSLYPRTLDVVWDLVMRQRRYRSVDELDETVNRIISFS